MDSIISVRALSKKYQLRRAAPRYRSLREEISAAALKMLRRPLRGAGSLASSQTTTEDLWAIRNVSFEVTPGDRLGIIGRNGAGKSTLLKILSRITDPTEGQALINGRISSLLEVGTGFHPELSGRENIFLNGAILGMKVEEVRRKFDQIVAFAEVERFLDTPVKRYSSGMYVRLAFAVAAHLEPDVLVVDEVLAVGDAQFQEKCLGRMGELSSSGRTILFVTHNMDAMLSLCNRGIVLDKGLVVFDGDAFSARQHYISQASAIEYSVDQNAGRGGSGGVNVKEVWVSSDTARINLIESGDSIWLNVLADVSSDYRSRRDLGLSITIDSIEGQRLHTGMTSWDGFEIDVSTGKMKVACKILSVPFAPGKYLVGATIIFRGDTLDCVLQCASFEVIPKRRVIHVERLHEWGPLDLPCEYKNLVNAHE